MTQAPLKPVERTYRLSCGHTATLRSVARWPVNTTTVCKRDGNWVAILEEVEEPDAPAVGR